VTAGVFPFSAAGDLGGPGVVAGDSTGDTTEAVAGDRPSPELSLLSSCPPGTEQEGEGGSWETETVGSEEEAGRRRGGSGEEAGRG
jgi:hypothetical protein